MGIVKQMEADARILFYGICKIIIIAYAEKLQVIDLKVKFVL